jgi:Fur family peroxide stress response transcriptional regulator
MKYSKQREEILQYLKSVCTHPTAEQIYVAVREKDKSISLGTVYRNLDKLSKDNIILRIKVANGKDRFDFNITPHYHAICTKCGKVSDVFIDYFKNIDEIVEKNTEIRILSHDMIFNTICSNCNEK